MSLTRRLRRPVLVGAAALSAVALGAGPAMAHHCFIPMYNLEGPRTSANWLVVDAQEGAQMEAGYTARCDAAVDAGYAALRAARLPVAIKIKISMTIADPKHEGRMAPNGADGKGLEYFGAGSELPMHMVGTWIAGAEAVDCTDV